MNCDALDIEDVKEMRTELVFSTVNRAGIEPEVGSAGGIRDSSYVGVRTKMMMQMSHKTAAILTFSSRSWCWHGMGGKSLSSLLRARALYPSPLSHQSLAQFWNILELD